MEQGKTANKAADKGIDAIFATIVSNTKSGKRFYKKSYGKNIRTENKPCQSLARNTIILLGGCVPGLINIMYPTRWILLLKIQ
jgi:hypothetical protein